MEDNNPMLDHLAELGSMLNSMRKSNALTDIILVCDDDGKDVVYPAHKTVLIAASKYFRDMFNQNSDKKDFKLLHVSGDILEILLEFMYTGTLEIAEEIQIGAVLATASRYQLRHAVRQCTNMILKTIRIDSVMDFVKIIEDYQIEDMKQALVSYMEANFKSLIDSSIYVQLPFDYLETLMSGKSLNCSAEEIIDGVFRWILYDEVARKEKIDNLLKNIDLSLLSTAYMNKISENPFALCNDRFMPTLLKEFSKRINSSNSSEAEYAGNLYSHENNSLDVQGIFQKDLSLDKVDQDLPEAVIMGFIVSNEEYNLTSVRLTDGSQSYFNDSITLPLFQSFALPYHAAVCVFEGNIYFFGGSICETPENGSALQTVIVYNIKLKEWGFKADMKEPRYGCGCAILNKKVYVIGGRSKDSCLPSAAYFEISSNTWVDVPDMSLSRLKPAVFAFNGYLYALGGDCQSYKDTLKNNKFKIGEKYKPSNKQWTTITTRIPIGRELRHRCYRMASVAGRVFAVNVSSSDNPPIHRIYEYEPKSGKWESHQLQMEDVGKVSFIGDYGGNICLVDQDGNVVLYSLRAMKIIKKYQMKCLDTMSYSVLAEL